MKREFLQDLKVEDRPLSKEVIDAIMAENGRDIEAAKKHYADYDTVKQQLEEAKETIESLDIEGVRKAAKEWEDKYDRAVEEHKSQMADMTFHSVLSDAIRTAKGRSFKAISALLDLDALKGSENQQADIEAALEGLQKECGYLFDDGEIPPRFAPDTGKGGGMPVAGNGGLAGALRERYRN